MKFLKATFISWLLITLFSFLLLQPKVNGFFFDYVKKTFFADTGSLRVKVEDFQIVVDNRVTVVDDNLEVANAGQMKLNSSAIISFNLKDVGSVPFNYYLDIGIAWEKELSESGKFYIYPENLDDATILNDIENNNSSQALIKIVNDIEDIDAEDLVQGKNETLDSGFLLEHSKFYKFKLFFYRNNQSNDEIAIIHNKFFELLIKVTARSIEEGNNWEAMQEKAVKFFCYTQTNYPIIDLISKPNAFFIDQKNKINLNSYINAYDENDGDLNNKVEITTPFEYDLSKAGKHHILYTVTNSLGNSTSVKVLIVIWDFVKIESGNYHTLALTSHGKVYIWGYNARGQLGDGTTTYSTKPKLVEGLNHIEIIDIAAGTNCSFALSKNGQIYSWGRNDNGKLGDSTTTERRTPVKAVQPADVKFIQISASFDTAAALSDKGEVYTWGYSGYGASGNGSAQEDHKPTKIALENIIRVEVGYYNGAAIDKDGTLFTWGDNYHGQLGIGQRMAISYNLPGIVPYFVDNQIKIKDVNVGWYHMVAVSEEGELYTWGYGYQGRLGNNSTSDKNTPQKIAMSGKVAKGFAAYYQSAIIMENQQAYFFGQNAYGKLGTNNTTNYSVPTKFNYHENISDISLALDSSFVLVNSQIVYGMGYGGTGVLGNGASNNSTIPVSWAFIPPDPEYYY